jgi:hypothetical protein
MKMPWAGPGPFAPPLASKSAANRKPAEKAEESGETVISLASSAVLGPESIEEKEKLLKTAALISHSKPAARKFEYGWATHAGAPWMAQDITVPRMRDKSSRVIGDLLPDLNYITNLDFGGNLYLTGYVNLWGRMASGAAVGYRR